MNKYLTEREIYKIDSHSKNIYFEYPDEKNLPREETIHTEIFAYSPKNKLILIKGNEHTGHKHIRLRHNFWSIKPYIIEDKEKNIKFQKPSRFPRNTGVLEELKIADLLYSKENLVKNNIHSDSSLFDLYEGEITLENNKKEKGRLLLYKNTKIIHTLFLLSNRHNKKKIKGFPFQREKVQLKSFRNKNKREVFVPYVDTKGKLVYGLVFTLFVSKSIELQKLIIICDDEIHSKEIELGQREVKVHENNTTDEIIYQHADLREFERIILKIENELITGKSKLTGVSRNKIDE